MIQLHTALLGLLLLAQASAAWAVEFGITRPAALGSERQSYFERPDILQVESREHPEPGWQAWRQAHLEAAAAFLELYPTEHLYFLARDSELIYDAVRLISRDDPQTLARLHLLNVSRANMRDEHLLEYLAQEGITVERLRTDSSFQPIFIDTGFSGTIPGVIAGLMPVDVRSRFKTHLLASSNPAMPSLRSFLLPINPAINGTSPSSMHGTIVGYEHIARATDRSDAYQSVGQEWHPTSSAKKTSNDGQVNATKALHYQEDLRNLLESSEGKAALEESRRFWKELRQSWTTLSKEAWIDQLKTLLAAKTPRQPHTQAAIRDFLEWVRLIGTFGAPGAPILQNAEIGLSLESGARFSNKSTLIAQYPQWEAILQDPDTHIPALLDSGQIGTLGAILDVINDAEITRIARQAIIQRIEIPQVYALVEALIENMENRLWLFLLFRVGQMTEHPELLKLAIEKASPDLMLSFGEYVLSYDLWIRHPELLRLAIEKTPPEQMHIFASHVFKQTAWTRHPELLRLAIEKAPAGHMRLFALGVFNHVHWVDHSDLLRIAIERAPPPQIEAFAPLFGQPGRERHPELVKLAIERTPPEQMQTFADHVFSYERWSKYPELLRLAIERAPPDQMQSFAYRAFSKPHWSSHPELLRLAIEKAPLHQLSSFSSYIFSQRHWIRPDLLRLAIERTPNDQLGKLHGILQNPIWRNHPLIQVFWQAVLTENPEQRRDYLRSQLGPDSWESEAPSVCEQQMLESET